MRKLPDELRSFFDSKITVNGLSPNDLLIAAAKACIGITEEGGDNCGHMVELFQSVVSRPQGQSWCLDFVEACVAYVEAVTGSLSQLPASEGCLDLWGKAESLRVAMPQPGDIIIWQFGQTIHGHTGIIIGQDSLRYQTIEGNTSNAIEIDRNGNGVYMKNRAKGGSKTFVEVGFLRVFGT